MAISGSNNTPPPPPQGSHAAAGSEGSATKSSKVKLAFGAMAIAAVAWSSVQLYMPSKEEREQSRSTKAGLLSEKAVKSAMARKNGKNGSLACEDAPQSGPLYGQSDPGQMIAPFVVVNHHRFQILLTLFGDGGQKAQEILAAPGQSYKVLLPSGRYSAMVHAGSKWCNPEIGFRDGVRAAIEGDIDISVGKTAVLEIQGRGNEFGQFSPAFRFVVPHGESSQSVASGPSSSTHNNGISPKYGSSERAARTVTQDVAPTATDLSSSSTAPIEVLGESELKLRPMAGHYWTTGYVAGFPVVFMVDTGASYVALPEVIASRIGIRSCKSQTFQTATGSVKGCITVVPELRFGAFRLRNVEVSIIPGKQGIDSLLGMNVLRKFRIEQKKDAMTVSVIR